jgi:hypothetical protein
MLGTNFEEVTGFLRILRNEYLRVVLFAKYWYGGQIEADGMCTYMGMRNVNEIGKC